jgi:HlyD family secretion protein
MTKKLQIPPCAMEFQSDAIELEHRKLPFPARIVFYMILFFLAVGLLWACLCKVDKIVTAEGKLITTRQNITMKPLERTVIKKINVQVGQTVKTGQILITFDPTFNKAEEERLREQYSSLTAQFYRVSAESLGKAYMNGRKCNDKNYRLQASIFAKRQMFYKEKLNYFDQNLRRIQAGIVTKQKNAEKQNERLKTLLRIENMLTGLYKKGSISLKQLLETQISRLQMEAETDRLENQLLELKHQLLSVKAEKNSFIRDWQKQIAEELVKVERERNSVDKQLDKAKRMNSLVVLRAPCDAVVHEIASFQEGSGVREAEPLITLVPMGVAIEAEVDIDPKDIGLVKVGDVARIKLDAFPFQKYGTLSGKVRVISQDTFQQQSMGVERSYYRARVVVSGRLDHVPSNFRLVPGMRLKTEIKVGKRRVIEYLIYPLIKALDESLREP